MIHTLQLHTWVIDVIIIINYIYLLYAILIVNTFLMISKRSGNISHFRNLIYDFMLIVDVVCEKLVNNQQVISFGYYKEVIQIIRICRNSIQMCFVLFPSFHHHYSLTARTFITVHSTVVMNVLPREWVEICRSFRNKHLNCQKTAWQD